MSRESLFDEPPRHDGPDLTENDQRRLSGLLARVHDLMSDGAWRTIPEITAVCGGMEASVSARLRDLRKEKFGGHTVNRRRRSEGLWEYQMPV